MKLALLLTWCLLSNITAQETWPKASVHQDHLRQGCICESYYMDCSSRGKITFSKHEVCPVTKTLRFNLELFNNSISSLSKDVFNYIPLLTGLNLNNNSLTTLPKEVFSRLIHLQRLVLSSNKLVSLPEGIFQGPKKLSLIDLSGNKLRSIPHRLFVGLGALTDVSLSDNDLSTLPADTFSGIRSLERLNLAKNKLTHLPRGLFQGFESVQHLDLSGNQLTQISPEGLKSIRYINHLSVQGNRIASIPQYTRDWPQISFSIWSDNNIKRASEEVFRSWLGSGDKERRLSMQSYTLSESTTFPPEDVKWAVMDNKLKTEVDREDCRCGKIKFGKAAVDLCVRVDCGSGRPHADWVSALRSFYVDRVHGRKQR